MDIGDEAFSWCESLNDIQLPTTLERIGKCAFDKCKNLTSITIPQHGLPLLKELDLIELSEVNALELISQIIHQAPNLEILKAEGLGGFFTPHVFDMVLSDDVARCCPKLLHVELSLNATLWERRQSHPNLQDTIDELAAVAYWHGNPPKELNLHVQYIGR